MAFCDFCQCKDCKDGWDPKLKIHHAKTDNDRWICDVCYLYDLCTSGPSEERSTDGPCKDRNCKHRPRLVSKWSLE